MTAAPHRIPVEGVTRRPPVLVGAARRLDVVRAPLAAGEEVIVVVRAADDAEGGTGGGDTAAEDEAAAVPVLGPSAVLLVGGFRRGLLTSRVGPPQHGIRSSNNIYSIQSCARIGVILISDELAPPPERKDDGKLILACVYDITVGARAHY